MAEDRVSGTGFLVYSKSLSVWRFRSFFLFLFLFKGRWWIFLFSIGLVLVNCPLLRIFFFELRFLFFWCVCVCVCVGGSGGWTVVLGIFFFKKEINRRLVEFGLREKDFFSWLLFFFLLKGKENCPQVKYPRTGVCVCVCVCVLVCVCVCVCER